MTIVSVHEERTEWLPNLRAKDLPHPLPTGFTLLTRAGQIGLNVSGVVGTIPLANGATLQVIPKVGPISFLRMLYRSLGSTQSFERQFEEFVEYAQTEEATLPHFAARQVSSAARAILRRGTTVRRVPALVRGREARGQLQPHKTALALARHEQEPVHARARQRSRDTPENRVINAALQEAIRILPPSDRAELQRVRELWERRATGRGLRQDDLELVEERIKLAWYGGPRAYYQQALTLSLVLLGLMGLGGEGNKSVRAEAHLMESATVFEQYLRQVISDSYGPRGYVVMKAGLVRHTLYVDGSFGLEPDIVIASHAGVELVADAKYKTPDAGDHYQMLSYLRQLQVRTGVLLTPADAGIGLSLTRQSTPDGYTTVTARLPLDDLTETEAFLGALLALA
jgi:5-methylcytosine-specific restriction endonuclease McrBC regulatory subunit McrC